MDAGLVLMGHHGSWDDARYAESRGFKTAGFVDSPLLVADPFVAMALAAERTSKLRVGTLLAIPGIRIPAALVTAIATINRLAPGRTFLGIGTGFTGRAVFGLRQVPVERFAEYVEMCRRLLAGEEVRHEEGKRSRMVKLRQVPGRYVEPEGVPVYVGADGPRALDVVGRLGDGWMTSLQYSSIMGNSTAVFEASLASVRDAAAQAARSFDSAYTMWSAGLCVLEEGEPPTSERALQHIGAYAMLPFHAYADNPAIADYLPPPVRQRLSIYEEKVLARLDVPRDQLYQEVHRGHLSYLLDGEREVLTDEIVRMTTLTGTAEQIAAVLRALEKAGLRNVTLNPPPHFVREQVDAFADKIAPLLGGVPA